MRADRFGSYSIDATRAGMSRLSRRKSMARASRLCPPPRCRTVRCPLLLRPEILVFGPVSRFSGRSFERASSWIVVRNRIAGEVGRYVLIAIVYTTSENSIIFSPAFRVT